LKSEGARYESMLVSHEVVGLGNVENQSLCARLNRSEAVINPITRLAPAHNNWTYPLFIPQ
jgi:hypothetical protein